MMGQSSAVLGDAVSGNSAKSSCVSIYIPVLRRGFELIALCLARARVEARAIIWHGLVPCPEVESLFAEPLAIWENMPC